MTQVKSVITVPAAMALSSAGSHARSANVAARVPAVSRDSGRSTPPTLNSAAATVSPTRFRARVMSHIRGRAEIRLRRAWTAPTGMRKFSVKSSAREIVMSTKPIPNASEPRTCAPCSPRLGVNAAVVTTMATMPTKISMPPAKPVAARPAAERFRRRSPSAMPSSQMSCGLRPLTRGAVPGPYSRNLRTSARTFARSAQKRAAAAPSMTRWS